MAKAVKITRQTLANDAAARWAGQYSGDRDSETAGILAALTALGTRPLPDDVDRVIGNTSWTTVPDCDGCGASGLPAVVRVGEEPDYYSGTATLCGNCVADALRTITSETP